MWQRSGDLRRWLTKGSLSPSTYLLAGSGMHLAPFNSMVLDHIACSDASLRVDRIE